MTEPVKTVIYVGAALVVALIAYATRPVNEPFKAPSRVNKSLLSELDDPSGVASLEIVKYDEAVAESHKFKVERREKGNWVIPSHADYPADADDQMKKAATALMDLTVLDIASELPSDHKLFGVIEPTDVKSGEEGVGELIVVQDAKGKDLGRLVVGKKVKGEEAKRFVRIAGQDPVYVVKIDTSKLSTKFEDWIKKDLLSLSSWDIQRVQLNDYSVVRTAQGGLLDKRFDLAAKWDSGKSEWQLEEFTTYSKGKPVASQLVEGEELNKEKLNDVKTAVGDLKIVDVRRKPQGLTADLKAGGDFLSKEEAVQDLAKRGFFAVQLPGKNEADIVSANGEVHVWTGEAVEYVLRFGNTSAGESDKGDGKLNRYLFVSVRYDESKIPYPTLEKLPDEPEEKAPKPDGEKKSEQEKKDGEKKEESEPKKDGDADEKDAEEKKPEEKKADKKEDEEEKRSKLEKEKERITKENQRKIDDHNEKSKKAKEKVNELNGRFADWYYVISEDTYKKLRLGREDLIKEGTKAKEEGTGVDAFRELQKDGLKKE